MTVNTFSALAEYEVALGGRKRLEILFLGGGGHLNSVTLAPPPSLRLLRGEESNVFTVTSNDRKNAVPFL